MILYLYTDTKKLPPVTRLHNQLSRFDHVRLQIINKNIIMIIKDEKVIANEVFHTKQNASTTLIRISRRCWETAHRYSPNPTFALSEK